VAALADHLGLARFALLGVSGGAPYALACAWRLATRVSACALVCPLGPVYLEEIRSAMAWPSRLLLGSAQRTPWLPPLFFGGLVARALARRPGRVEALRAFHAPPADRDALARPEVKAILGAAVRDAMQHGARGALEDLRLYTSPWGIPLQDIQVPVHLWHGQSDGTVPLAHAHWYDTHLPHRHTHYLPLEGHYSLPLRHAGSILACLLETES
jgi:pimeloyl-ACP methyl ester carboxylesterase